MASLESQAPKDAYFGLIKTTDDAAVGATKKAITDGGQNATGLGLSSTKVFANTLRVENAPTTSTNTNVATLNASGDIEGRTANSRAFASTLSDVIFARADESSSTPLDFVATGTGTADSYVKGDAISLNSASNAVVVTGEIGELVEVDLTLDLQFEQNDAEGAYSILQNGTTIATSSFQNITEALNARTTFKITIPSLLATTSDSFSVSYADTSGVINWKSGTILKVQKIY